MPAYISTGALSDMHLVKLVTIDGKQFHILATPRRRGSEILPARNNDQCITLVSDAAPSKRRVSLGGFMFGRPFLLYRTSFSHPLSCAHANAGERGWERKIGCLLRLRGRISVPGKTRLRLCAAILTSYYPQPHPQPGELLDPVGIYGRALEGPFPPPSHPLKETLDASPKRDPVPLPLDDQPSRRLSQGLESRRVWSNVGMIERGKREIPEKTRRPAASSGTFPTCENPVNRPGWEASSLTTTRLSPRRRTDMLDTNQNKANVMLIKSKVDFVASFSSVKKGVAGYLCSSQWRNNAGSGTYSTVKVSLMPMPDANFACLYLLRPYTFTSLKDKLDVSHLYPYRCRDTVLYWSLSSLNAILLVKTTPVFPYWELIFARTTLEYSPQSVKPGPNRTLVSVNKGTITTDIAVVENIGSSLQPCIQRQSICALLEGLATSTTYTKGIAHRIHAHSVAVHDKVSTFELNLRKKSLPLLANMLTGALSDMRPLKLVTNTLNTYRRFVENSAVAGVLRGAVRCPKSLYSRPPVRHIAPSAYQHLITSTPLQPPLSAFRTHPLSRAAANDPLQQPLSLKPRPTTLRHVHTYWLTVFDTSWRTLAQSSPSSVTADNQCAFDICIFLHKTVESSLQVIELANFPVSAILLKLVETDLAEAAAACEEGTRAVWQVLSAIIGVRERAVVLRLEGVGVGCQDHDSRDGRRDEELYSISSRSCLQYPSTLSFLEDGYTDVKRRMTVTNAVLCTSRHKFPVFLVPNLICRIFYMPASLTQMVNAIITDLQNSRYYMLLTIWGIVTNFTGHMSLSAPIKTYAFRGSDIYPRPITNVLPYSMRILIGPVASYVDDNKRGAKTVGHVYTMNTVRRAQITVPSRVQTVPSSGHLQQYLDCACNNQNRNERAEDSDAGTEVCLLLPRIQNIYLQMTELFCCQSSTDFIQCGTHRETGGRQTCDTTQSMPFMVKWALLKYLLMIYLQAHCVFLRQMKKGSEVL
ncbi:hypothetical protein PR048_033372 [Dryococelus australis]|uniref:Uncharacterized protein n=1 Tax=Dryococelus australis TaxID=614101 RepID=A0ABQ9G048_9NEOP|nr:hypothetical protein PR048_033372 [Dryococelus australis]